MLTRTAAVAVLALLAGGCSVFPTENDEVSFNYVHRGDEDHFDQVLEIKNDGFTAIAPTLSITPLDGTGEPVPGVTVSTAFGSDRGQRVVSAFFTDYDLLKFEGTRADEVRNVRVRIKELDQVHRYPEMQEGVRVRKFDDGTAVPDDKPFDAVELDNRNDHDVAIQIYLIGWQEPEPGETQQFDFSIPAGDSVTVPAHAKKMVPMPPDLADSVIATAESISVSHAEDAVPDVGDWRTRAGREREP